MAIPANLIVNMCFNPPECYIIGPIKEATVNKLSATFPGVCTSSPGQKGGNKAFIRIENPPHWYANLSAAYCNEEMGQSQLMLTILDSLEEDGSWKLKGSNAINHDESKVTYKFFFVQKC
eukprot:NODE_378_length_893_cov_371.112272_g370_i0.p1 GENE.NODE_378_length_893_cov_371.112272_g370_i0~~NODE_378_length_893_cov_371.112272_g370_i0.p1  ORF type:complete len:120 (-),score=24.86 NODE_378_length_893_cov_371.112272_g370_i0:373-732(-)